jgi:hypothetical protein
VGREATIRGRTVDEWRYEGRPAGDHPKGGPLLTDRASASRPGPKPRTFHGREPFPLRSRRNGAVRATGNSASRRSEDLLDVPSPAGIRLPRCPEGLRVRRVPHRLAGVDPPCPIRSGTFQKRSSSSPRRDRTSPATFLSRYEAGPWVSVRRPSPSSRVSREGPKSITFGSRAGRPLESHLRGGGSRCTFRKWA